MQPYVDEIVQAYRPLADLTPDDWQRGVVRAADGAELHYTRTGGEKPALLLLHGVQGAGLMWLRTAQALADWYDVVMPDARGHGRSSRIAGQFGVEALVDDALAILRALGLDRPFVVGHSMGADIAGRLAARQAARALVLADPALHNFAGGMAIDIDNPPPWMAAVFATLRELQMQPHAERMLTGRWMLPPGTPQRHEADYVGMVDALAQFDLEFYRSTAAMSYLFEADDVLAHITCPKLLLTARPMMPGVDVEAGVARLRRSIPALQHVHFADSGHFLMYDQFERFVAVVCGFLKGH